MSLCSGPSADAAAAAAAARLSLDWKSMTGGAQIMSTRSRELMVVLPLKCSS